MSFLTALSLSLNNLMTKKARTVLVSFAGSIGIIGIALIMSLSNGVNAYIQNTEQETLSEYPLEIDKSAFSMTSMMGNMAEAHTKEKSGEVNEIDVVNNMFSGMSQNDLASLKTYFDSGKSDIDTYARSIEYQYNVEPQLYLPDTTNGIKQVNPNNLMANSGIAPTSSMYSSQFSMNDFSALPKNDSLYRDSYEVSEGRWPQNYNEAVVVLSKDGSLTDMTLYSLGLKDYSELEKIVKSFQNEESSDVKTTSKDYQYQDFIGIHLKLVNACDAYAYDDALGVYASKSNDEAYMKKLIDQAEDINIVGVVKPKEDANIQMLSSGVYYSSDLVDHIIQYASNSEIVKKQLEQPDKNIFTGKAFGEETSELDTEHLFTVDEAALANAFKMDSSKINIDLSKYLDVSSLSSSVNVSDQMIQELISSSLKQVSQEEAQQAFMNLLQSYRTYMENNDTSDPLKPLEEYLTSGEAKKILMQSMSRISKNETNSALISEAITSSLKDLYTTIVNENHDSLTDYLNTE